MIQQRIVVIGDAVQPASATAQALRLRLGERVEVLPFNWDTGNDSDFASAAFASEKGESLSVPSSWKVALKGATCIVTHFFPISDEIADLAPNLEVVATLRTGSEHISATISSRGVQVINNPGREADAVSDFAATLILDAVRRVTLIDKTFRSKGWSDAVKIAGRPANVRETTIGLVGFGNVGRLLARKLSGFKPLILAYDPFASDDDLRDANVQRVELDELLQRSDVVSLHARLTEETRSLIGNRELAQMRSGAWLVNTARAELISEVALLSALDSGQLRGVSLDVFWSEPLDEQNALFGRTDVVLSPHVAGSTTTSQSDSNRMLAERIAVWAAEHWFLESRDED